MIKPTNGRIVWYTPAYHTPLAQTGYLGTPLAAVVTHVHDERSVNLAVFNCDGSLISAIRVPLLQDNDLKPVGISYAEWMPYQIGQAKKSADTSSPTQSSEPPNSGGSEALEKEVCAMLGDDMGDYRVRLRRERAQIEEYMHTLSVWIRTTRYGKTIARTDREGQLLLKQSLAMRCYATVLDQRIAEFGQP